VEKNQETTTSDGLVSVVFPPKKVREYKPSGKFAGTTCLYVFCHVFQAAVTTYETRGGILRPIEHSFVDLHLDSFQPPSLALVFEGAHWTPLVPTDFKRRLNLRWTVYAGAHNYK
jgi:hypothetical protein